MQFKFCKHSQINQQELEKIVDLKKRHWNYTSEEHLSWIALNIKEEDIHVLMFEKEKLVAYLNLINTEVLIDDTLQPFIGIGNVCSSEKGKGYGGLLIKEVDQYLIDRNQTGILLCKDSLVGFYLKNGWKLLDENKVKADFPLFNTMIFTESEEIADKNIYIKNEF
jgi:uncharacterized protein (UPF0276 family)